MRYQYLAKLVLAAFFVALVAACGRGNEETIAQKDRVITGVNFVGMSVSDMQRSVDFYSAATNLLPTLSGPMLSSLALEELYQGSALDIRTQLMKSTNAQLLFMDFNSQVTASQKPVSLPVYGPGIAHVCYQVNEKTHMYQRFLAAGGSHIGDLEMVQLNSKNPVKYAYGRDLDGAIVEIEHVDVEALDLLEPPKNDYRIRHVSLATSDMGSMLQFYSILLEQAKPRRIGRFLKLSGDKLDRVSGLPESKVEMAWFQIRNLELELIQYHSHPTERTHQPRAIDTPGYNMIVLDVKDLALARSLFMAAGGEIVSDIEPAFGGEILFGRDPDGNLLGMQKVDSGNALSSQNFSDNGT